MGMGEDFNGLLVYRGKMGERSGQVYIILCQKCPVDKNRFCWIVIKGKKHMDKFTAEGIISLSKKAKIEEGGFYQRNQVFIGDESLELVMHTILSALTHKDAVGKKVRIIVEVVDEEEVLL